MKPRGAALVRAVGPELLFVLLVLSAVTLMILPLPTGLIDIFLTLNIGLSLVLLILSLSVEESLALSVFPALLLVSTLMRLSMNVSTTRSILIRADGGRVIEAFGHFVVGGNLLAGAAVFLIITIIQFLVISKGAERVAEVSARFVLDGMPGKQMSIDADLRSGVIDQTEAGRRRRELEREAQFYGAMDGAMKFVKGDAVAGLLITLVNILGGLAIGVAQKGFSLSQALDRYTLLTVGDGLVSQIPALLVSTSAGLLVTRVRAENAARPGRQLAEQLLLRPEALFFAGLLLVFLGLVPGMPALAFVLLGAVLVGAAAVIKRRAAAKTTAVSSRAGELVFEPPGGRAMLSGEKAAEICRRVETELGIKLPPLRLRAGLAPNRWALLVEDIPLASGRADGSSAEAALEMALKVAAPRLVGVQEAQEMLDRLERSQPALVREVVPRLVPPVLLAEVLGRLVEEELPVQNLRLILSTLAEWARVEADGAALAERVRAAFSPLITRLVAPEGVVRAWLLSPEIDQLIERSLQKTEAGQVLALDPQQALAVAEAVERCRRESGAAAVILTRPEIRRPLWRLLSSSGKRCRVVAFTELEGSVEVVPAGKIVLAA